MFGNDFPEVLGMELKEGRSKDLNVQKLFLATAGISLKAGLTYPDIFFDFSFWKGSD